MQILRFLFLSSIFTSCSQVLELKKSPFEPNLNATVDNLRQWGFEVQSSEDGVCVYTKDISSSIHMFFYLDHFNDNCYKTTGQGIIVDLDTLGYHVSFDEIVGNNDDKWFAQNQEEFQKDSLKIIDILKTYNGLKISNAKRLARSADLIFDVNSADSKDIVKCVYTAYPDNQKALIFEKTWTK